MPTLRGGLFKGLSPIGKQALGDISVPAHVMGRMALRPFRKKLIQKRGKLFLLFVSKDREQGGFILSMDAHHLALVFCNGTGLQ